MIDFWVSRHRSDITVLVKTFAFPDDSPHGTKTFLNENRADTNQGTTILPYPWKRDPDGANKIIGRVVKWRAELPPLGRNLIYYHT